MTDLIVHAARSLRRSSRFSATVVGLWTLGLSAATVTYSLADAFFFRPPPHVVAPATAGRIHSVLYQSDGDTLVATKFSYPQVVALQEGIPLALFAGYEVRDQNAMIEGASLSLRLAVVTNNYFELLGTRPRVGRFFRSQQNGIVDDPGVVLSERLWARHFDKDPNVVGRYVRIRHVILPVVGIAPGGLTAGEPGEIDAWITLDHGGELVRGKRWKSPDAWWLSILARMPVEMQRPAFEVQVGSVLHATVRHAGRTRRVFAVLASLAPGASPENTIVGRAVALASAAGVLLLLIASINVGGLFILRSLGRQRDLAIRRALGAPASAVLGELWAEISLLAIAAAIASSLATSLVGRTFGGTFVLDVTQSHAPERHFLIISACVVIAMLAAALIASFTVLSTRATAALGSDRSTTARGSQGPRNAILGLQAAAATVLVAGAFVLTANLVALRSLDLGLDIRRVVLVAMSRASTMANQHRVAELLTKVESRAKSVQGVESASLAISAPFMSSVGVAVNSPDHPEVWQTKTGVPYLNAVGWDYFRTVGTRLVAGRFFAPSDSANARHVVLINQTFAGVGWQGTSPLGRCIVLSADFKNPCYEIIGVIADARRFTLAAEEPAMQVYIPLYDNIFADGYPPAVVLLRTRDDPRAVLPSLIKIARQELPHDADVIVRSLEEIVDPQVRPWRTAGTFWISFGIVALLIMAIGLHATVAYAVRQRTREIAIRLALGATAKGVAVQVARHTALASVLGIVVGGAASVFVLKLAVNPLNGVMAAMPWLVAASVTCVTIVTAIAGAASLSGITRTAPMRSLQAP